MSRRQAGYILAAVGVAVLLSSWGRISDWTESLLRGEAQVRTKKVVYWTASGSPEVDLKRAREFERIYPDINIEPNFRETGGLQDILFISFLSGNPPDSMSAKVNEIRKYVLMGGLRPFDDLLAWEEARLTNQRLKELLAPWRQVPPIPPGDLPPMDRLRVENDQLQAELVEARVLQWVGQEKGRTGRAPPERDVEAQRRLVRQEIADQTRDLYYQQTLLGRAGVYHFRVNPDDRILRDPERYPREAARLLNMHGRPAGFRSVTYPATLTYNKRLFREAAKMFPDAGLVDGHGEAVPPETWLEFHEKARVITEYGKRAAAAQGLAEPVCYGVVIQGQRTNDLLRGIKPLAERAGSVAFDFAGDTRTVHQYFDTGAAAGREAARRFAARPIGYFDYQSPQHLAAFALLYRLRDDGFALPGTESRHYEDVRTALASGRAAMVIDGWHAALIGAERVPWAAQDLGSASIPRPYHEVDAARGWTGQKVEAEKAVLYRLLALDEAGIAIPPGNKVPRAADEGVTFFTALCRDPDAAWEWHHFALRAEEILKTECRRGVVRLERKAMQHRGDPEWFPYPYQAQVYDIIEHHCAMWPEKPIHGPLAPASEREVFYKYFYQTETRDLGAILREARARIAAYSEAANRDLARRIEDGIVSPAHWTFPDWDPKRADEFFQRQQDPAAQAVAAGPAREAEAGLAEAKARLVAHAKAHPGLLLLDSDGAIRQDVWKWESPETVWQILWVPGLMLAVIAGWFVWMAVRDTRARRPALATLRAGARRGWPAYFFILPGMLAIFAFAIYPSLYQFYLAFYSGDGLGAMRHVGWENFAKIFAFDSVFWLRVIPNTLLFMVVVTFLQITVGLAFASLLNLPLRANRAYRVLYFIPMATALVAVSVILLGLLKGEDSGLNQLLLWAGQRLAWTGVDLRDLPSWLGLADRPGKMVDLLGPVLGLWTVMGVAAWHGLPGRIIYLLAGLQSISPELYEAAKVDGAGPWKRFCHITLPELMPILIVIAFTAFIDAARAFSVVFVLTEGGVDHSSELVATYIFKKGFMKVEGQEADLGYASALGIVYSLMLAGLTVTNVVIIARRWKRRLRAEQAAGRPVPPAGGAA